MRPLLAICCLAACGFQIHAGTDGGGGDDIALDAPTGDGDVPADAPGTMARRCTLSLGSDHTCVFRDDGTVWCWGEGAFGELAQGGALGSVTAVQIPLGAKAIAFATKSYHACAALEDGTVRCWGMNDGYQIGDNIGGNRYSPATVTGLTDVIDIGVGRTHSCARRSNGTITCWGTNTSGQLGDTTTTAQVTPSTTVVGLTAAPIVMTIGSSHNCVVLPDHSGQCWGSNVYNQLGDGTTTNRTSAIAMPVSNLVQIAPSGYSVGGYSGGQTCVLKADHTVWCWGSDDFGQLGNGATTASPTSTPMQVTNLSDAVEVVAGRYHACARRMNGTVSCWGRNEYGQIGDGTFTEHPSPYTVALPRPAIHIGTGGFHTCAMLDDNSLRCWGNNGSGQLGDGSLTPSATPVVSQTVCL